MRRLTKSASSVLFASVLCSTILCYASAIGVSAETATNSPTNSVTQITEEVTTKKATTTKKTTKESKTSNAGTTKATEAPKSSLLDDAITVSPDTDSKYIKYHGGWWIAEKDGYYAAVVEKGKKYYSAEFDKTDDTKNDNFEAAIKYNSFNSADEISDRMICSGSFGVTPEDKLYIVYSEDGSSVSQVIYIDYELEEPEESNDISYAPDFTGEPTVIEADGVTYEFSLTNSEKNGTLETFEIYKYDENGYPCLYDEVEIKTSDGLTGSCTYKFVQNGKYQAVLYNSLAASASADILIESIDASTHVVDDVEDTKPPIIEYTIGNEKGLADGDICSITIKTNEVCDISLDGMTYSKVKEAKPFVRTNGKYIISASDAWGNTSNVEIEVRAFGDGKLPEEIADADGNGFVQLANDNPLNGSNRDSYWASVGEEDDSANGGSSVLPQTGSPAWIALVAGAAVVTATAGGIAVKKSGILKRRKGDTKK